jgi:Fe-S cluster biosynthesis and repair protein YggX
MPESCARCQKSGEAPEPKRIPFGPALKEKIAASVCSSCWKEWEEMEIKVINEYRLNFMEPEHRKMIQKACLEFLNLPA